MVDLASGDANDDLYDAGGVPPTPGVAMGGPVFTGIPSDRCDEFWERVSPVLWRVVVRTDGRHTLLTTKHAIEDNRMQLWVAFSDHTLQHCTAALVTETLTYPSGIQVCEITFAAGQIIPDCLPLLETIETWAKSVGCSSMRLIGRKGWARVLDGYTEEAVILERVL